MLVFQKKQHIILMLIAVGVLFVFAFVVIPTASAALSCSWQECESSYWGWERDLCLTTESQCQGGNVWDSCLTTTSTYYDELGYYLDECQGGYVWDSCATTEDVCKIGYVQKFFPESCTQYSQTCPADSFGVCSYTGSCDTTGSRTQTTYSCSGSRCVSSSTSVSCSRTTEGSSCVNSSGQLSQCQGGSCAVTTISISASASPTSVYQNQNVAVSASVGGSATGSISYRLDCDNDSIYESGIETSSSTNYTFSHQCSFNSTGSKTIRVRVDREGVSATTTTSLVVQVDNEPPIVWVTGEPTSWTNKDATAVINCSDSESGCDSSTIAYKVYSADPGVCSTNYLTYQFGSSVNISSHSWVCGAAKDQDGNIGFSIPQSTSMNTRPGNIFQIPEVFAAITPALDIISRVEFKIDKDAPESSFISPISGSWQVKDFSVSILDVDTGGSPFIYFRYGVYDGGLKRWTLALGAWRRYNTDITISVGSSDSNLCQSEGVNICQVQVNSRDLAGNESVIAVRTFSIDYSAPEVGSFTPTEVTINRSDVFSVSIFDAESDITSCRFFTDSGPPYDGTTFEDLSFMTLSQSPCPAGVLCTASRDYLFRSESVGTRHIKARCKNSLDLTGEGMITEINVYRVALLAPPTDNFSVGECTISITGRGWDVSDIGEDQNDVTYRLIDSGADFREIIMDDNPHNGWTENLRIRNIWTTIGNRVGITTEGERLGTTDHNVAAGFDMSVADRTSDARCKISIPNTPTYSCLTSFAPDGVMQTVNTITQTTNFDITYCGDGVRSCGEVCDPNDPLTPSCKADCSSLGDTIDPTITLPSFNFWYKSLPNSILTFNDNGKLNSGEYRIGDETEDYTPQWRAIPNFTNINVDSFSTILFSSKTPEDIADWDELPDGEGQKIYIRAYDDIGNCTGCDNSKYFSVKKDTTGPTINIIKIVRNSDNTVLKDDSTGKDDLTAFVNASGVEVTISENDLVSGNSIVSCVYHLINNDPDQFLVGSIQSRSCNGVQNIPIGSICTMQGDEACILWITSMDELGNITNKFQALNIDTIAPR